MTSEWISRLAAGAVALVLSGAVAGADEIAKPIGVVELFTSQGCSSCPPADALFGELAASNDVIALAYHVDYWDYLGWRDTLGSADNTARQYEYGKAFGLGSVYTPQAVINGRVHVSGSSRSAVNGALDGLSKAGDGLTVPISASQVGDSIMIDAGSATGSEDSAHVVLVYFDAQTPVVIERGENSGSTITYWNAVSKVQTAGMWHGKSQRFELPVSEIAKKDGCAVLLQSVDKDGLPGPILGATVIRRPGAMPK